MKNKFALTVSLSALLALTGCAVQPVALTPVQKELIASTWSEGEGTVEAAQLRKRLSCAKRLSNGGRLGTIRR